MVNRLFGVSIDGSTPTACKKPSGDPVFLSNEKPYFHFYELSERHVHTPAILSTITHRFELLHERPHVRENVGLDLVGR
jgi:hypothetical protein